MLQALYHWIIVHRFVKLLENDPDCRRVFKRFLGMPFLPADRIENAVRAVIEECSQSTREKMNEFFIYHHNYWIKVVTPWGFSIYGLVRRNSNMSEQFNARMKRTVKEKEPEPYVYLGENEFSCLSQKEPCLIFSFFLNFREAEQNSKVRCTGSGTIRQ